MIDNSTEFKYIDFSNKLERQSHLKMINDAVNLITSKLGELYVIEKKVDV